MKIKKYRASTESEMLLLGIEISNSLNEKDVIFLNGDLGAGKTTLSKGILKGLGYKGLVKSPTYTLVEEYFTDSIKVYHFDLYRLSDPEELEWIGIRDYFTNTSISLIEWPEKGGDYLPQANIKITIEYSHEHGRIVSIMTK